MTRRDDVRVQMNDEFPFPRAICITYLAICAYLMLAIKIMRCIISGHGESFAYLCIHIAP